MITIRYANLPEGSHAQAVVLGRHTVIYLRPGLTPEQRRLSLRRAMQSARMGHGPRLPAIGVALAIAGDSVAVTLRNIAAAVRGHPFGSLLLVAGVSCAVACYVLLATASIKFIMPAPPYGLHPSQSMPAGAPFGMDGRGPNPVGPGQLGIAPSPGAGPGGQPRTSGPAPSPHAGRSPRPTPSASPGPTPSPTQSPPSPSPSPTRTHRPPPPSPSPSPSPSRLCILGICL
jgi:hypothetical protein